MPDEKKDSPKTAASSAPAPKPKEPEEFNELRDGFVQEKQK